ncbi:hypothetical protein BDR05DRAFT_506895 [Suillus weaverae]|nr:hypothetical protein BDR05DRAFT_506895 [Suillus weaverae]
MSDPGTNRHYLCFTQLKILWLYFDSFHIYLNMRFSCSTWPHIYVLKIQDLSLIPSHVTSCGLFTALHLYPHLHVLRVPINTATIDIDANTEPIPHTSPQTLELETTEFQIEKLKLSLASFSLRSLVSPKLASPCFGGLGRSQFPSYVFESCCACCGSWLE